MTETFKNGNFHIQMVYECNWIVAKWRTWRQYY